MTVDRPADRPGNPFATIGIVLAAATLLVQLVLSGATVLLPVMMQRTGSSASQIGLGLAGVAVVILLLHLVTALLGVLGLVLRRSRRALAGAATGIGSAGAIATLGGLLLPQIVGAFV